MFVPFLPPHFRWIHDVASTLQNQRFTRISLSLLWLHFSTECDLLFSDETVDSHLRFFPTSNVHQKNINMSMSQRCSFYYGDKLHAQYLGCDGAWNEIPAQSVIDGLEVTPRWSESRLSIRVCILTVNGRRQPHHF